MFLSKALTFAAALTVAFAFAGEMPVQAQAQGAATARGPQTGLPLPRFASLRPDQVNVRTGPGLSYPIDWIYQRPGLPVEIVAEFDTWRKIRDYENAEGWVHQSMLNGQRGAMIRDGVEVMRKQPDEQADAVARLEAGVVGTLKGCEGGWCELDVQGRDGWVRASSIYGVEAGELNR
jgi:SH3-like domain-containing protein